MLLLKKVSFYLAILGFIGSLLFILFTQEPIAKPVFVQEPTISPFKNFIAAEGIVESENKNITIGTPEPGLVTKVWHLPGDHVKQGDPLFQIDTRQLEATLALLKAKKDVALSSLKKLQNKLQRMQSINDPRAISSDEVQTLQFEVLTAEAEMEAALAAIKEKEVALETHTVRAPSNGVILDQQIRIGEYADNSAKAILFGDIENLELHVSIDEVNASYFDATMPAVAFPKSNSEIQIPLKFKRIDPYVKPKRDLTGETGEKVYSRVLYVIYEILQPEGIPLYVGQLMDVYIEKKVKH